jgi:hypothetical protein
MPRWRGQTSTESLVSAIICFVLLTAGSSYAQERGCFEKLHDKELKDADYAFDLRFDRTKKNESFSCDLEMRASAAAKAIELFRFGVLYDSARHIAASVQFPLVASVRKTRNVAEAPRSVRIGNFTEWDAFKRANFTKLQVAEVACASLYNVEIVKSRSYGFMTGSGMIWFQALTNVPGVRVTAVNLVPVDRDSFLESCAHD